MEPGIGGSGRSATLGAPGLGAEGGASALLSIPDEAIRYILFQRTEYSVTPLTLLYRHLLNRLPFTLPLYNLVLPIEARLRKRSIAARYERDMAREYASLEPFLPARCSALLDIGCGVAGIDVFLHRHYARGRPARQGPEIYLLDKTRVESSVYYMFEPRGAFYNSLPVARGLLVENGVPSSRVHLLEATGTNEIDVPGKVDLVVSLISWGFHYPVDTYADRVRELLSDDGVVILDVRKGTDGMDALRRRFGRVDVVFEREKWRRVAAGGARGQEPGARSQESVRRYRCGAEANQHVILSAAKDLRTS